MDAENLKLAIVVFVLSLICSGVAIGVAAYFEEMDRDRDFH